MSDAEVKIWKSRFLFKALPVFLLQLQLAATKKKLQKDWNVPSNHYRLDFLNFIRWCEFPLIGASQAHPKKLVVDMLRLNRLVMAITLIIEACYYISGNEVVCDVKGNVEISLKDIDPEIQPDLFFDCKKPS